MLGSLTTKFFSSFGLTAVIGVDSQGKSGGLVLVWSDMVAFTILDMCPH